MSVIVGCGCIVPDDAGRYLVVRTHAEIAALGAAGLLRGTHVERAPLPEVVPASAPKGV